MVGHARSGLARPGRGVGIVRQWLMRSGNQKREPGKDQLGGGVLKVVVVAGCHGSGPGSEAPH